MAVLFLEMKKQSSAPDSIPPNGFTLVELIVVMVVVGILAVTVMPRFADQGGFAARGFYDGTLSILRYAQKSAVAQRRTVCVAFGADSSVTLTIASSAGGACDTDLAGPEGGVPYTLAAPNGVVFAAQPADFNFLSSGAASVGQTFSVAQLADKNITVVATTGYVQEN